MKLKMRLGYLTVLPSDLKWTQQNFSSVKDSNEVSRLVGASIFDKGSGGDLWSYLIINLCCFYGFPTIDVVGAGAAVKAQWLQIELIAKCLYTFET